MNILKQAIFDCEWNALELKYVTFVWCIVIKDLQTGEIFKYNPDTLKEAIIKLDAYNRIIGHNIIAADLPVLEKIFLWRPKVEVIDTLILSRLANPDRRMPWGMKGKQQPHSLSAWAIRLGMPQKVEHEDWSQYSEAMMERCVHDVRINEACYKAIYNEFKE